MEYRTDIECRCGDRFCKYYRGVRSDIKLHYCKVFKNGIPPDIAFGDNDHLVPVPEQGDDRRVYSRGTNLQIVKPKRRQDMLNRRLHGHDTICSTIRDIYMKSDDVEVKMWACVAQRMAKNMMLALIDYKQMLTDVGIGSVSRDDRNSWQLRRRSLYRRPTERQQ